MSQRLPQQIGSNRPVLPRQVPQTSLPGALYHLGYMQLRGKGVDTDPIAGYVSMLLAGQLGNPDAERVIPKIEGMLSSEQIEAGRSRVAATGFDNPSLIQNVDPEYPELARVARLEAQVIMEALIDTNGRVTVVSVRSSTLPDMGFEEAAIAAVSEWRFEPARRRSDGEPIAVYFTIFTDFKLH